MEFIGSPSSVLMALILPAWRIITRRKRRNDRLGSDVNWRRLTSQQGRALVARLVGGGKRDSKRMTIAPDNERGWTTKRGWKRGD